MIYVHIPFCRSFCTYCDFYSEVAARNCSADAERRQETLFESFGRQVAHEIGLRKTGITDDVNTLYIGGGTPSVLPLSVHETIVEALRQAGHGGPYDEFTVEVNPEDVVEKGEAYIEGLMNLGVNRISMGVQSFDDDILRFMNRRHNAAAARKACSVLENAGIRNISIDLIFGLPQLSDDNWIGTLDQALDILPSGAPPHISSYQLSVEPGSALNKLVQRGLWQEAPEEQCSRQYDILCGKLSQAGYNHYEISNFAQPGYEAVHNSAYWKHVPYMGFGPGAHSFVCTDDDKLQRQWNLPDLKLYLSGPEKCRESESLDEDQLALEHVMLALRTSEGVSESFLDRYCDPSELALAFASGNLIRIPGGMARIPEDRFFISDNIISSIV